MERTSPTLNLHLDVDENQGGLDSERDSTSVFYEGGVRRGKLQASAAKYSRLRGQPESGESALAKEPVLNISQKPMHVSAISPNNSQMDPRFRIKNAKSPVLMLTQQTQTENRSLIKQLLTLINETIMQQLSEQAARMSKEEFEEAVDLLKQTVPTVYDKVRAQSDTFFI